MPPPPPGASQHATSPTGLVVALDLQGDLVHLLQPSLGPAWSQACRRRPGSRLPVAKRGRRNAERDISKIGKNAGTGTRSRKQLLIPEDLSIAARASPDFFISRPSRNQIRPSQSSWSPTGAERRRIIAQPSEGAVKTGALFFALVMHNQIQAGCTGATGMAKGEPRRARTVKKCVSS
jgi:hypothetical protein